jgi:hypothetical protein
MLLTHVPLGQIIRQAPSERWNHRAALRRTANCAPPCPQPANYQPSFLFARLTVVNISTDEYAFVVRGQGDDGT